LHVQQLVCVGVGYGYAARATAHLQRVLPTCITNIQSSKRVGGEWVAEWLQTTKLFHTVLCAKPCDNRVTEKPSTFSRARPCVVAPRPGLEPGTYGLTEHTSVKSPMFMRVAT